MHGQLGPVDYVVVELPTTTATALPDRMAAEITSLVERNIVRILDLLVIARDSTGSVDIVEFEDLDAAGLTILDDSLAEILSLEDVDNLASAVDLDSAACVVVWEYLCTLPFADSARDCGASLVAQGRIPAHAIVASLEADAAPGQRATPPFRSDAALAPPQPPRDASTPRASGRSTACGT